ncbi:uncharacterized protein LOC107831209 [Nicotiana tabacum]|uniref:Uncharacterized protein LOC107831209 n=1 Tax=Nicotiana tabacum TaxID=4097 RepID=A0AC58U7G8_TOBAC
MREGEMVDYFLQTLEPTYFGHLVTSVGKSFNEVVKMGGMVEEGLRSNKIMSYSAIKATTQAIQSSTGGALGKKKIEEVATVEAGTWSRSRGPSPRCQPRPHHQNYPHTPYNPPQPYYPLQEPHFSVHHAQTYTQPPARPQWRAPFPQNTYPPPQNIYPPPQSTYPPPRAYRNPSGLGFRGNQAFRNERVHRQRTFTPLGETYTTLFHKLRQLGLLSPVEPKLPNPLPKNLDHSVSCEYCLGAPGHDTEKCWKLKTAIQDLIDTNRIEVQAPEAPNINENPLPVHHEAHIIELVHEGGKPKKPSQTVMMIRASPNKKPTSGKAVVQLGRVDDQPVVVMGKGSSVVVKKPEPVKVVLQGLSSTPVLVVKGARIEPVVIRPVMQLLITSEKAVPWSYSQVTVMHKGKKVVEEVCEAQGLTRSGRCFAPVELRRDNPITIKKPVTEEEAEEFLKKMKA